MTRVIERLFDDFVNLARNTDRLKMRSSVHPAQVAFRLVVAHHTVGQVQRVGHSRLDPDCTSTDYGRCRDRLAETLRPYHFSGLHVERAEDAGLASENNKVARNGGRRGYTQLGSVLPTNGPVHRVDRVEEIVERAHKQRSE